MLLISDNEKKNINNEMPYLGELIYNLFHSTEVYITCLEIEKHKTMLLNTFIITVTIIVSYNDLTDSFVIE